MPGKVIPSQKQNEHRFIKNSKMAFLQAHPQRQRHVKPQRSFNACWGYIRQLTFTRKQNFFQEQECKINSSRHYPTSSIQNSHSFKTPGIEHTQAQSKSDQWRLIREALTLQFKEIFPGTFETSPSRKIVPPHDKDAAVQLIGGFQKAMGTNCHARE